MANASARAARDGWLIYTSSNPPPSRDEINGLLESRRVSPISKRTYDHYGRLARHGYDHYVPINELDMAVKASKRRLREAS